MTLMDESVRRGAIYSGGPFGGAANLEAFTVLFPSRQISLAC